MAKKKKIKKKRSFMLILLLLFIVGGAAFWLTWTPYGWLDIRTGVINKLHYKLSPDPGLHTEVTPEEKRVQLDSNIKIVSRKFKDPVEAENFTITSGDLTIPLRFYPGESDSPLILFFHGGGWTVGSLDSYDALARLFEEFTHYSVISVDYPLAPENPFPAAPLSCYTAFLWASREGNSKGRWNHEKIILAGDSSGGNLAASVSLIARDNAGPVPAAQVLFYPVLDISRKNRDSYTKFGTGFMLNVTEMMWYADLYAPHQDDRENPLASPLLAHDFSGLPPAIIFTPFFDILKDEAETYAEKLKQAGVPVFLHNRKGVTHGYLSLNSILSNLVDEDMRTVARELIKLGF